MKERLSNFELLRFIAMLMILLVHANYATLGGVSIADCEQDPIPSFARMLFEQISIVAVNVFILISGWFGIKATIKGATSLIFQVVFYSIIISILGALCSGDLSLLSFKNLFPLYYMYWFIAAYLILYVLSPVLNAFTASASKITMAAVVVCFFALEMFYGFVTDMGKFIGGYSAISFIGIYLLARFICLHSSKLINIAPWRNFGLYILFTIIPVVVVLIGDNWFVRVFNSQAYNSPFVILASVFLFLSFSKMNIQNNRINWLAASSFAIYVIHSHPIIFPYYAKTIEMIYSSFPIYGYIAVTIIFAVIIGFVCVAVDQGRIVVWRWLCEKILDKVFVAINNKFSILVNSI